MRRIGFGVAVIVGLLSAASAGAQHKSFGHYAGESVLRGSVGAFTPDGDSEYWTEKEIDFTVAADDYQDFTFTVDYIYFVSPRLGVLASLGGWQGKATQSYREFVDNFGNEIRHVTTIDGAWFDVGLVVHLLEDRAPLMPYVGLGGSWVGWELVEEGEFIDFGFNPPEVVVDSFLADGSAFGFFWLVGIEIPLGSSASLYAEGRWRDADDELNKDFAGFGTFDLSGRSLSAGVAFSF
jgi:opacity protein-like surface antigen